ncbi:MAG TPA: HNH endonuclease, partial [Propionicimonas sp.]
GELFVVSARERNRRRWCGDRCRKADRRATAITAAECAWCGEAIVSVGRAGRRYCSRRHGWLYRSQLRAPILRARATHPCRECGTLFARRNAQYYCSEACWKLNRIDLRPANHKRPGVRASAKVQEVVRRRVYDRDGWQCWICLGAVDPDLRGRTRWAASLDHVLPLSRGGDHTESNLRLAHFGCNSARGAKVAA